MLQNMRHDIRTAAGIQYRHNDCKSRLEFHFAATSEKLP
jgi:hypothetical protein